MSIAWFVSYTALWVIVLFQGLLCLALLKQLTELRQLDQEQELGEGKQIELGSDAPEFSGVEVYSGRKVGARTIDQRGALILFLSPHCSICKDLVASMEPTALDGLPPIIAFCRGSERACATFARRFGVKPGSLVATAEEAASRYRAFRVPTVVAIGGDRTVRGYAQPKHVDDLRRLKVRAYAASLLKTGSKSELALSSQRSVV
jgi:hypothetical protein